MQVTITTPGLCLHTINGLHLDVVRTRDPSTLEKCDIIVDVGATYDPQVHRYDHHQRGFEETFGRGYSTKLSSAGLIYKFVKDTLLHGVSLKNTFLTDTSERKLSRIYLHLPYPIMMSKHYG